MVKEIFSSPQVRRSVVISNELVYTSLPHELPNDLTLRNLGNQEILGKCNNFIELLPSAQSSSRIHFCQYQQKSAEKQKWNFFHSALFHIKTRVCLKYFVNNCLWKQFLASNSPQSSSNLICLTIFVNSFNIKLEQLICKKR